MRTVFKLMLCVLLGSAIGLAFNVMVSSNKSKEPKTITEGYGMKLTDASGEKVTRFFLDLSDTNEFNYTVHFTNHSRNDESFTLCLLLDYIKIPFKVPADPHTPVNEYKFSVANGASVSIPVRFSTESLSPDLHALAISVAANKDNPRDKQDKIKEHFGMIGRYTIKTSGKDEFSKTDVPDRSSYAVSKLPVRGIMINQQFENTDKFSTLPKIIHAKPNEKIKLAIRAGGFAGAKDYLAWLMIDDRQLPFPDGKPYWWFEAPPEKAALRQIEITAPEEPGRYEVYGYVMNSPWETMVELSGKVIGNRSSHKITIQVE